jgi:hypothetical protein
MTMEVQRQAKEAAMRVHTSSRARSRWVRLLVMSVVVAPLLWMSSAAAVVQPRDRVYPSYLPSVEQVVPTYPFLAQGSRQVVRYRGLGAGFSCWDWTQAIRAADGRWSFYTMKSGANPYFRGLEDPAVFVFKFHTRALAQHAFWQQQRFVYRCMGRQSADGTTARLWRQHVPPQRQGSIAYRTVQRLQTQTGHRYTRELHLAVLDGRYLVDVYTQARHFQPDTANAVQLARLALRNIG